MDSKPLRFFTHQPFFSAVRSGDLESIKRIVDTVTKDEAPDALMGMQTDAGETALYIAADNNMQKVFTYLLKFCDVDVAKIRSKSDMNAFHVAAKKGHSGIVKELLSIWPELCNLCDSSNTSPLYSAAVKDHLDVVNAILDADVNCIRIVRKKWKNCIAHHW
ncbi:hypothetical protein LWI29_011290 [Acer saccharum]|uniref:Uncharacterized protein n=1 Tax=Acer saccharum TaxID=4024 RepID=A0AA39USY4_ACESA|nr:hypothetical protein LWI29_011290 [Acer saccharum]